MLVMYDEPFAGLDPISLGVVGQAHPARLNDALGITSVVVTHDVYESLKIVDYLYFVPEGQIVAHGTPAEVRASAVALCAPVKIPTAPLQRSSGVSLPRAAVSLETLFADVDA